MTALNFDYLIEKVRYAPFEKVPFRHIYIENFFEQSHFNKIIESVEVSSPSCKTDEDLIDALENKGFTPINFPGTTTNVSNYLEARKLGMSIGKSKLCEGVGVVMRQQKFQTEIIQALTSFLFGEEFNKVVAEKFGIKFEECRIDGGIQKYLDGYEISPHPDIRSKATTFMININPSAISENLNHHTHYCDLKPEYSYLHEFWENNQDIDRCWVPWNWTTTSKQQTKNNSIVLFAPSSFSMHAVKAEYNHLISQRTQLYGNLWFKNPVPARRVDWQSIDIRTRQISTDEHKKQKNIKLSIEDVIHLLRNIKKSNPEVAHKLKTIL